MPAVQFGQWHHPLSGGGLGEADAVADGLMTWAWCGSRSKVAFAVVLGVFGGVDGGACGIADLIYSI